MALAAGTIPGPAAAKKKAKPGAGIERTLLPAPGRVRRRRRPAAQHQGWRRCPARAQGVRDRVTKKGKERRIGEFQESFLISPAEPTHTSSIKTFPDEYFDRDRFTGPRLDVQVGGQSYGPGGISYDDPASFIKVPIFRQSSWRST